MKMIFFVNNKYDMLNVMLHYPVSYAYDDLNAIG